MQRRDFCIGAWQAASFLAVGTLLEGCGGSPTSPSSGAPPLATVAGSVVGNAVTVPVAGSSPLATVGGAALVQSPSGSFLAFRSAQDAVSVMTAICTHEQCTINQFGSQTFTCPCHGSQYNTTGGVVRGPAAQSLRRFNASISNDVLTITL
jgi:Rieske Fe-S protein